MSSLSLAIFAPHVTRPVPRPMPLSKPLMAAKRRNSESQLQSLVARVQCGDWPPVLTSLLRDRLQSNGQGEGSQGAESQLLPRSIYRETLFLNVMVSSSHLDIGTCFIMIAHSH